MKTTNKKANYYFSKRTNDNNGIEPSNYDIAPPGHSCRHFETSPILALININGLQPLIEYKFQIFKGPTFQWELSI
jgi:hypothetical protein